MLLIEGTVIDSCILLFQIADFFEKESFTMTKSLRTSVAGVLHALCLEQLDPRRGDQGDSQAEVLVVVLFLKGLT